MSEYVLRKSDIPNSFYRVYSDVPRITTHFNLNGLQFVCPCDSRQLPKIGLRTPRPDLQLHAWYLTDLNVTAYIVEAGTRWSLFEGDVFGELTLARKLGLVRPP